MKNEDYIVIQSWMRDLGLPDKALMVYALIWGYSRDGRSRMRGTAAYIARWVGCDPRHARRLVRHLEDLGLIEHEVVVTRKGVVTEFWAVLPDAATMPEKGSRDKISWTGKRTSNVVTPYVTDVVTPHTSIKVFKHKSGGGGKNTARSRALDTTTTTGFLFENNGSGLAPGEPVLLSLPFTEPSFREAWSALLRQPAWAGRSADALQMVLDDLAGTRDPVLAAYCCRLAVKKGWDSIKDPQKIMDEDFDQVQAFAQQCYEKDKARKEGAAE